ncbi:DNA polymerase III subunit beta [Buchnera aphidicola]|uniref:Beta sliding clamp n=1 Tax=Buchnera aphidicola (Therioaphis trifolii) TaxID=1241884 RepID=A0A4D6YM26_9GAMM|nr:DNA polymerase III subunit beta [Buchnera aphidicola]QCI27024.1 DNA polymerase III subunit beta [Buchnera aphidicola (Therioaphis trifolii)]
MKFTIKKTILLKSLQKLNSIIYINYKNEIINNILFHIEHNNTYLISTNLELELIAKINCIIIDQIGEIIVSAKKILNIIRSFPNNSEINIIVKNNIMKLQYHNIYFKLHVLNPKHFPRFQQKKNIDYILINQDKFKNIIYNTHYAMAKQDIRHYLNGMNIEINKGTILSVSTDGYRMAISKINYENIKKKISIIIPYKTILELIKILEEKNNKIKISFNKNSIKIYLEKYIISSKLIDNQFPNYKQFLKIIFQKNIIINRQKIKEALTRASILTNQKIPGVRIIITNGICTISANNEQDEIVKEKFKINYFHTPIELTMNIHYILDVINIIDNDTIKILLNNENSSICIQDNKFNNSNHIIMPLIL